MRKTFLFLLLLPGILLGSNKTSKLEQAIQESNLTAVEEFLSLEQLTHEEKERLLVLAHDTLLLQQSRYKSYSFFNPAFLADLSYKKLLAVGSGFASFLFGEISRKRLAELTDRLREMEPFRFQKANLEGNLQYLKALYAETSDPSRKLQITVMEDKLANMPNIEKPKSYFSESTRRNISSALILSGTILIVGVILKHAWDLKKSCNDAIKIKQLLFQQVPINNYENQE